jgi:ribonucleotide monophosphatase NagD (HAD superfamily)
MYEQALLESGVSNPKGLIKSIGKPFEEVYLIALQNVQSLLRASTLADSDPGVGHDQDRSRVCMVGDALETDVAGGTNFGIATVWVLKDGVYKPDLASTIHNSEIVDITTNILNDFNSMDDTYATGMKLSPTYLLPHFRW